MNLWGLNWNLLLAAIATVESDNDPNAIGDNGQALGLYQLHAAYVADVVQITGIEYDHRDALNPHVAREMVIAYLRHYGTLLEAKTCRIPGYALMARIHNGGPNGDMKPSTVRYATQVLNAMHQLQGISDISSIREPTSNPPMEEPEIPAPAPEAPGGHLAVNTELKYVRLTYTRGHYELWLRWNQFGHPNGKLLATLGGSARAATSAARRIDQVLREAKR